jgi:phasin family protein
MESDEVAKPEIPPVPAAVTETALATAAASLEAAEPVVAAVAETAEKLAPAPKPAAELFSVGHDAMAAITESQAALATGMQALALEFAAIARSSMSAMTQSASAMLRAETLADAIEVQAAFTRRSVDTMIEGSAKLSEIGVKLTSEASRPLLSQFGTNWSAR